MAGETLLSQLQSILPDLSFVPGNKFHWSPRYKTVNYKQDKLDTPEGMWALLHEAGHGQLAHRNFRSDFELLQLEIAAWQQAKQLAAKFEIVINQDHIEDCLDTYRDWLHRRSTCPTCYSHALQRETGEYHCHNCNTDWHVSSQRFCRPYRRLSNVSEHLSSTS